MFKWFQLPQRHFDNIRVTLLLKAVATTVRPAPKFKGVFSVDTLKQILCVTLTLPFPQVFKTLYLFTFFYFLGFLTWWPPPLPVLMSTNNYVWEMSC